MARILAIDDELDMLTLIKNILIKGDHIVDIYQTTVDIDENSLGKYDLILLDVMMPEVDGISYCKNIRSKVDCPIIFLTAKAMETDIVDGLLSGGDDYITKPFGVGELLARVEAHLRREQREKHSSLNLGNIRFDLSSNQVFVKEEEIHLTKSEYQISKLLAKRKGQVFSREQIFWFPAKNPAKNSLAVFCFNKLSGVDTRLSTLFLRFGGNYAKGRTVITSNREKPYHDHHGS